MHLDGLLAYAAFVLWHSGRLPPKPDRQAWAEDITIPVARWSVDSPVPDLVDDRICLEGTVRQVRGMKFGKVWGWCCSNVFADWVSSGSVDVRKRPPHKDFVELTEARSYQPGTGLERGIDKRYPTLVASQLTWYCIGQKDLVRRLIRLVPAVGKIRNHGHGTVTKWQVERTVVNPEWICSNRIMPVGYGETTALDVEDRAIRPPYWHPSKIVPCRTSSIC